MSDISAIALSGLRASETRLSTAADNIANAATPGYKPKQVQQTAAPEGGTDTQVSEAPADSGNITDDVINAQVAQYTAEANLKVIKANDEMQKQLIDLQA